MPQLHGFLPLLYVQTTDPLVGTADATPAC